VIDVYDLPAFNALLNGTSALLLFLGRGQIRSGNSERHKKLMIAAFSTSILFLVSYLVYHSQVGSVRFTGEGWVRPLYFTILITHTILAAAVPILATLTLVRGLKARYQKHTRIARWTYPVWLYVSATGVVIYLMLYQIFPSGH
jgi:uncharacterized membrane protein YozB (DUF420 family)